MISGLQLRLADEGSDALDARQPSLRRQFTQRAICGHPADPEITHQVGFERYPVTRIPGPSSIRS